MTNKTPKEKANDRVAALVVPDFNQRDNIFLAIGTILFFAAVITSPPR